MPKINVRAHLNRYANVDAPQLLELIEGLKQLVEANRIRKINEMRNHLQKLENGEFPPQAQPTPKKQTPPIQQQTIVEEPSTEPETTQEEALDNL